MYPITGTDASGMVRQAQSVARKNCALTGLGELTAGCTELVIRRTNASQCRSEHFLFWYDAIHQGPPLDRGAGQDNAPRPLSEMPWSSSLN
jgi:hypothetical protein